MVHTSDTLRDMENLPQQSYLLKRNGQYYFRIRAPKHLRSHLSKAELKISLNTKELAEAKRKLSLELIKAQQLFHKAELELTAAATSNTPTPTNASISKDEVIATTTKWFQREQERALSELRAGSRTFREETADTLLDELMQLSSNESASGLAQAFAIKLLNEQKIDLEREPVELRMFAYQQAHLALLELANFKLNEIDPSHHFNKLQVFYRPVTEITPKVITLSKTIELFKKAKVSDGHTDKTLVGYKLLFDFALEFFGKDKPINTIQSSDCRDMRNKLAQLPSNARKKFPTLSLMEAIEAAPKRKAAPLSITSVNDHMQSLSAIFNFAVAELLTDHNPVKAITLIKQKGGQSIGEIKTFTKEDIRMIFTAPIFTGCEDDERNYSVKGNNKPKRHRYWIPLIAYFTGMRLNEICQLFHEDILIMSGIYCIKIEADDNEEKKLKTVQSRRVIPIPEQLIRLGFIEFVEKVKKSNKSKRLFSSLTISARGSLSDNFSKWFANFLQSAGVTTKGRCFHSFRHHFADNCRNAGIGEEFTAAFGGWTYSGKKTSMRRYGAGHELRLKHEAINKLSPLPADIEELIK